MPKQYEPSKYATHIEGDSLTEQEWKDSCDINKMIRDVNRGLQIRGGPTPEYGYDDTTMTALQHRMALANAEAELKNIAATHEFTEEELNQMQLSPELKKKFGFKVTKKTKTHQSDLKTENDQTTNEPDPKKAAKTKTDPDQSDT